MLVGTRRLLTVQVPSFSTSEGKVKELYPALFALLSGMARKTYAPAIKAKVNNKKPTGSLLDTNLRNFLLGDFKKITVFILSITLYLDINCPKIRLN